MNFEFNTSLIVGYNSPTQKARVLTEDWLGRNMYCPICGEPTLTHFEANRPVADFYCKNCKQTTYIQKMLTSQRFCDIIYKYAIFYFL